MLRNKRGVTVDPVPFLVVVATAFVVLYSFGPAYLLALGVPLAEALGVLLVVLGALSVTAYHRLVWTHQPGRRGLVPADQRLQRLFYVVLVGIGLLALLALPLVT